MQRDITALTHAAARLALLWAWQVLDWAAAGVLLGLWLCLGAALATLQLVNALATSDEELAAWRLQRPPTSARFASFTGDVVLMGVLAASGHYLLLVAFAWPSLVGTTIAVLLDVVRKRVAGGAD